ncbi:MAG TPA: DUF2269 family protein [Candidatus Dormibacteraeota bacterium]|nr:DUF2269 family protein [Candidatus Dormibacteraeota bacterium]
MAYSLIKYLHVLLAITAVGSNITYAAWNVRAARETAHLAFVLRGIKFIDDRIANPSYGLLLVTGLALRFIGFSIWPRWMVTAIVLYVVMVTLGLALYSPALSRQIRELEAQGPTSPSYLRWGGRARVVGITTGIFALVIVFMMVVKPTLGG